MPIIRNSLLEEAYSQMLSEENGSIKMSIEELRDLLIDYIAGPNVTPKEAEYYQPFTLEQLFEEVVNADMLGEMSDYLYNHYDAHFHDIKNFISTFSNHNSKVMAALEKLEDPHELNLSSYAKMAAQDLAAVADMARNHKLASIKDYNILNGYLKNISALIQASPSYKAKHGA